MSDYYHVYFSQFRVGISNIPSPGLTGPVSLPLMSMRLRRLHPRVMNFTLIFRFVLLELYVMQLRLHFLMVMMMVMMESLWVLLGSQNQVLMLLLLLLSHVHVRVCVHS